MKLPTMALAIALLIGPACAFAQSGNMMDGGWMGGGMGGWMGGYGGVWIPILLVIVVGLVAWIVMQKRK